MAAVLRFEINRNEYRPVLGAPSFRNAERRRRHGDGLVGVPGVRPLHHAEESGHVALVTCALSWCRLSEPLTPPWSSAASRAPAPFRAQGSQWPSYTEIDWRAARRRGGDTATGVAREGGRPVQRESRKVKSFHSGCRSPPSDFRDQNLRPRDGSDAIRVRLDVPTS
ncbi:hypothetical protein MTO96_050862 [Rhipicephalus appendiculatus]